MLIFDKMYALAIAVIFGLAGLPWAFWLFRNDREIGLFEKSVIGYIIGIVFVPLMFLLQNFVGILFDPIFVYINWAIVFLSGMILAIKDKAIFVRFAPNEIFTQTNFVKLGVVAIMLSIFSIGFSVSATPVMELDPYFYLDGVKQVIEVGKNYANDGTAWYPLEISSHMGQPIWKYMIASWASVYGGMDGELSLYTLVGVGSIYPPIIGALAAFCAYFLFSRLYNMRAGLLGAGLLAFLPVMTSKFRGGAFEIEPYNIFAFVFLMAALAYALRRNTREAAILAAISVFIAFLASNLAILILALLSLSLFAVGVAQFMSPSDEGRAREKTLIYFVGAIVLAQIFVFLYNVIGGIDPLFALRGPMQYALIPAAAFGAGWVLSRIGNGEKDELSPIKSRLKIENLKLDLWSKIGVLALISMVGIFAILFSQSIPVMDSVMKTYVQFGAYTEPLYRTIAEQAPGSQYYVGQLGFLGAPLEQLDGDYGVLGSLYNFKIGIANALNSAPNGIVNAVYAIFIAFMNNLSEKDTFEMVEKGNSVMTAIAFWGVLALLSSMIHSIYKNREWGLDAILILPFVVPVGLMAFGKAKLSMYLAVAIVFLAVVCWNYLERAVRLAIREYYSRRALGEDEESKKIGDEQKLLAKIFRIGATMGVVLLILAQFSPAHFFSLTMPNSEQQDGMYMELAQTHGYGAAPLLVNAYTPRIYDEQKRVLTKLEKYCALSGDTAVCSRIQNWENTIKNPVEYYESNLCTRSLWPYMDRAPSIGEQISMRYRCSFVAPYWFDSMEWIRENIEPEDEGSRISSWWDYGHWINFFGENNAVLRNEHGSYDMIGRVAASLLHKDVQFLHETMREYDSKYLLVDIEILGSGTSKNSVQLGGKYSALNYLGCAWLNRTDVSRWPGQSECENEHLWETVVIPQQQETGGEPCTISADRGISGLVGYRINRELDGSGMPQPAYCFAQEYEMGQQVLKAYSLERSGESGELEYVDARWDGYSEDTGIVLSPFYEGDVPEDASEFYHSNIYSAFFLDELEGFELVYSTPQIRIFKMRDGYWN